MENQLITASSSNKLTKFTSNVSIFKEIQVNVNKATYVLQKQNNEFNEISSGFSDMRKSLFKLREKFTKKELEIFELKENHYSLVTKE
jgi:hypothetical protein